MKYGPTRFVTDDVMPAPDLVREADADALLPMLDRLAALAAEVG